MGKTIYFLRHAKSSWENPDLDDHDRPLKGRGLKDAPEMGLRMKSRGENIECAISSSAKRALHTAQLVCKELDVPEENIEIQERLFHSSSTTILNLIQSLGNVHSSVMIIGHNPGMEDIILRLTKERITLPTAGLVKVEFNVEKWKDVYYHQGKLIYADFPKAPYTS